MSIPNKPQEQWTLEDWVTYWSPSEENRTCQCSGPHYLCAPCVIKELDASWRRTLTAERNSFTALRQQYDALRAAQ